MYKLCKSYIQTELPCTESRIVSADSHEFQRSLLLVDAVASGTCHRLCIWSICRLTVHSKPSARASVSDPRSFVELPREWNYGTCPH